MFGIWVPLWKWHAFNYMLGLACSTAITHKNRSFLSYKMEPLRYDPSGNATWSPIALPQIAFCTWLQVHFFFRLVVLFLQHCFPPTHTSGVSYSTQWKKKTQHAKQVVFLQPQSCKHLSPLSTNTVKFMVSSQYSDTKASYESLDIFTCLFLLIKLVHLYHLPHRTKFFHKHPSVDNVSETSVTDESMSESATTSGPRVRPSSPASIINTSVCTESHAVNSNCERIKVEA